MLKQLGISTLALAAALAVATPGISLARDRDDHRGGDRHEFYGGHNSRGGDWDHARDRDRDWDRDRHGWSFGFGYAAPVPVPAPAPAAGYYDQYGVGHAYAYYPSGPNYPNGYGY
jgi:hypothetical protein